MQKKVSQKDSSNVSLNNNYEETINDKEKTKFQIKLERLSSKSIVDTN